jgi:hypothetical protein
MHCVSSAWSSASSSASLIWYTGTVDMTLMLEGDTDIFGPKTGYAAPGLHPESVAPSG